MNIAYDESTTSREITCSVLSLRLPSNYGKVLLHQGALGWWVEGLERIIPECPNCGNKMTYFSADIVSEHYMCLHCNRFLEIPRRKDFFTKSPFKPRYSSIPHCPRYSTDHDHVRRHCTRRTNPRSRGNSDLSRRETTHNHPKCKFVNISSYFDKICPK